MVIREIISQELPNGTTRNLIHNYSDAGMMIELNGVLYQEAYDKEQFGDRVYKETNIPILE